MKKQLLLLALTLGTQISAETVLNALGELGSEYLTTITDNLLDFQKPKLRTLTTLLQTDVIQVTDTQLNRINEEIDLFFDIVSQRLVQNYRGDKLEEQLEDLTDLTNLIKEELPKAIQEAIQEAELQRLADAQRAADEAAALQRLVEEAALRAQQAPVISISATDTLSPNPIAYTAPATLHMNPQSAKDLSGLNETSSTDPVNLVFLKHGDSLEEFMDERIEDLDTTTQQEYKDALEVFFRNKGSVIDYETLSAVANRLYAMQKPSQLLLANELRSLEESSSSDSDSVVNTILRNHGGIFEQFMDEASTEENYRDALCSFLNNLGLSTTDYRKAVTKLAARLLEIQKPALDYLKTLDGESSTDDAASYAAVDALGQDSDDDDAQMIKDIDSLFAQVKEAAQGLDAVQLPSKKTNRSRSSKENRQRNRAMKIINQGSAENFIKEFQETLERLIFKKEMQDGQLLDENGCRTLLLSFFQTLDLKNEYGRKYVQMVPQLVNELLVVQEGLKERRQRLLDSSVQDVDVAQLPSEEELLAQEQARQHKNLVSKVHKNLKRNDTSSVDNIIKLSRHKLQTLIQKQWAKNNNKPLNADQCKSLLVTFLGEHLYLDPKDYNPMLPQLAEKLMSLQNEMLASSQPEVNPIPQPAEDTLDKEEALRKALQDEYASESSMFSLYGNSDYQDLLENIEA